jgi:putative flippase GtrA
MIFTTILTDAQERTRFLKFAVVGTIGAVVDFGVFNLLTHWAGFDPIWASVCSFTAAVVSNFIWNRYWTYPDSRSKALPKQLLEFGVVNLIGVGIRTPIFAWLKQPIVQFYWGARLSAGGALSPEFLGYNTALACAVVVVLFWNFFVNRYWTYNDVA